MGSDRESFRQHVQSAVDATRRVLAEEGYERLVIHAGALRAKSPFDDQDWPFEPVPMFRYFAPMSWPDSAVVISSSGDATLYAMDDDSFWENRADPDWELLEAGLRVERVTDLAQMHTMSWDGRSAYVGHEPREGVVTPMMDVNPPDVVNALHEVRTRKTPWEVACLEQASLRATRGHLAAAKCFDAGERSELLIHLEYLRASRQDDPESPYKNIVALGSNASTLHHVEYREMPEAASMLIDAGARALGYCADITRTHVASGTPAQDRFASLVDRLEQIQLQIIGRIEPGIGYEALHDFAHEALGRLLVEAELVTCSVEAAVASGLTRAFLPHGLGHHLGIQVHDVAGLPRKPRPENRFLRNTRTIEPHQVFTIEPGLYFIDSFLDEIAAGPEAASVHWSLVDELRPFGGIRIEDDVLVLPEGSEPRVRNLTREAFARADD